MTVGGIVGSNNISGRKLGLSLLIAFSPAAVAVLASEEIIKKYLFRLWSISTARIIGGLMVLAVSKRRLDVQIAKTGCSLEDLSQRRTAFIGCI